MPETEGQQNSGEGGEGPIEHDANGQVGDRDGDDGQQRHREPDREDRVAEDREDRRREIERAGRLAQRTDHVGADPALVQHAPGVDARPRLVSVQARRYVR